jgi:hypothetical protein
MRGIFTGSPPLYARISTLLLYSETGELPQIYGCLFADKEQKDEHH